METEFYVGTRFDNVRVELTKGANIRETGMESVDSCLVKIPNGTNLPKPYKAPREWISLSDDEKLQFFTLDPDSSNFILIVKKRELGIDVEVPVGIVKSAEYSGGFYQFIRSRYGYTYTIKTADVYTMIPRFEVGGA